MGESALDDIMSGQDENDQIEFEVESEFDEDEICRHCDSPCNGNMIEWDETEQANKCSCGEGFE